MPSDPLGHQMPSSAGMAASGAQGTARLTGLTLGCLAMGLLFALLPSAHAVHGGLVLAALAAFAGGAVSLLRRPGGRGGWRVPAASLSARR